MKTNRQHYTTYLPLLSIYHTNFCNPLYPPFFILPSPIPSTQPHLSPLSSHLQTQPVPPTTNVPAHTPHHPISTPDPDIPAYQVSKLRIKFVLLFSLSMHFPSISPSILQDIHLAKGSFPVRSDFLWVRTASWIFPVSKYLLKSHLNDVDFSILTQRLLNKLRQPRPPQRNRKYGAEKPISAERDSTGEENSF